jgi:hypothetical protein
MKNCTSWSLLVLGASVGCGCGASSREPKLSPCEAGEWTLDLADDSLELDLVGSSGDTVPDGARDYVFETSIAGPIQALVLVTTDVDGATCCGQQWDTLVGDEPIPATIGSTYQQGAQTWVLGVEVDGALLNADDGSLPSIEADCSAVRLVAGPPPLELDGFTFRAYVVRPDGTAEAGPSATY